MATDSKREGIRSRTTAILSMAAQVGTFRRNVLTRMEVDAPGADVSVKRPYWRGSFSVGAPISGACAWLLPRGQGREASQTKRILVWAGKPLGYFAACMVESVAIEPAIACPATAA